MKQRVIVGRLGAPHGVHGWMRVQSFLEPMEALFELMPWMVERHNKTETQSDFALKRHGRQFLVQFKQCQTPEQARDYTNATIAVWRDQLPALPQGEHYQGDLVGLLVKTLNGQVLGTVTYILETGANDVLAVKNTCGKTQLIPYIDQVVTNVDLAKRELWVDWDEDWLS